MNSSGMPWSWMLSRYFLQEETHAACARIAREASVSGLEAYCDQFEDLATPELEPLADLYAEQGIVLHSYHLPMRDQDDAAAFYETDRRAAVDTMRRHLERAAMLGAASVVLHPTTSRHAVEMEGFDAFLRPLARSLETLLDLAGTLEIDLLLENMMPARSGTRFASQPEHFQRFAAEFLHPRLGFCFDTGHALAACGPARFPELFHAMCSRLGVCHLSDTAGDRDSHLAPGRGRVDWAYVLSALRETSPRALLCIETPPFAGGPPYAVADWRQLVADCQQLAEACFLPMPLAS